MSDVDPSAQGAQGTGAPAPDDAEALRKSLEEVKADNAKLREERRTNSATTLAATHGFGDKPTLVALLTSVPADEQEAKAKALAAEFGQAAPVVEGAPVEAPPVEPANAQALQNMSGGDQGVPAPPPATVATGTQAEMEREVAAAKSLEEIAALQQKYREKANSAVFG